MKDSVTFSFVFAFEEEFVANRFSTTMHPLSINALDNSTTAKIRTSQVSEVQKWEKNLWMG